MSAPSDTARVGAAIVAVMSGQPLPQPGTVELTELLAALQRLVLLDSHPHWAVVGTLACGALVAHMRALVPEPATALAATQPQARPH